MKRLRNLNDFLTLRAMYDETLYKAITSGNEFYVQAFIVDYDGADREFYDFSQPIIIQQLQFEIFAMADEFRQLIAEGQRVMGM